VVLTFPSLLQLLLSPSAFSEWVKRYTADVSAPVPTDVIALRALALAFDVGLNIITVDPKSGAYMKSVVVPSGWFQHSVTLVATESDGAAHLDFAIRRWTWQWLWLHVGARLVPLPLFGGVAGAFASARERVDAGREIDEAIEEIEMAAACDFDGVDFGGRPNRKKIDYRKLADEGSACDMPDAAEPDDDFGGTCRRSSAGDRQTGEVRSGGRQRRER